MSDELKPCPFCGGAGEMGHSPGSWGYYAGRDWVECESCGVSGRSFPNEDGYGRPLESKRPAIEFWNKRAEVK